MHSIDGHPSLPDTAAGDGLRQPELANVKAFEIVRSLSIAALAVCALLLVALYNGYPTVFPDTGSYLWTGAFFVALSPYRAPGYSIFTRLTSLQTSAWFTIAAQGAIVVYLLRETCSYVADGDRQFRDVCLVSAVCVLTLATSLPWLVSLLMPDVFAGVFFLSAFLLTFADELRWTRKIVLALILTLAVSAHMSLFPIAAIFIAALIGVRQIAPCSRAIPPIEAISSPQPRRTTSVLVWLLVPVLAAILCTSTLNREMGLGFRLAPSQNSFLLGRLFGDGLAADFLRDNCAREQWISCRYLSDLPKSAEDFLFRHPLFHNLTGHDDEMNAIVHGALLAHPFRFALSSAEESFRQFVSLRTGEEFRSHGSVDWSAQAVQMALPRDFHAFSNSRQARSRILPLSVAASRVDTSVFWVSFASCLAFAWTSRFPRLNRFFYSAALFLVVNALICATLAGVFDRYQCRVAWIIPFCLTMYVCALCREWMRAGSATYAIRSQPEEILNCPD